MQRSSGESVPAGSRFITRFSEVLARKKGLVSLDPHGLPGEIELLASEMDYLGIRSLLGSFSICAAVQADGRTLLDLTGYADRLFQLMQDLKPLTGLYVNGVNAAAVAGEFFVIFDNGCPEDVKANVKQLNRRKSLKKIHLVTYCVDVPAAAVFPSRFLVTTAPARKLVVEAKG